MSFLFLFQRLRWVYLPASLLSMILQRAPLVRVLVTAESTLGGGVSALLRSAFTVAAVGSYHALAGATQLATSPATPASATAGQAFSMAFALTGAPSAAKSYEIKGTLPPGLSVPGMVGDLLNASTGTITGTPTTAGSYSLSIRAWSNTNKRGDGGNPTFTVQINVQGGAVAPPSFTAHPASASAVVGGSVNFSASATGGTVSYQWRKDGGTLAGATASTLSLTGLTLASAGTYDVVATNAGGSTTSNAATLSVTQPAVAPSFTSQPANASATVGGSASFTASASGTAPITYQWTKDGAAINGATSTTLTLDPVALSSAGSYQLTATNAAGSAQSNAATLTVTQPAVAPSFTSQPANASATVGGTASFTASASGTAPITYQWTKDGAPINGATSTTLTLNAVTLASAGSYQLTATNAAGSAQSNAATLTVTQPAVAPSFTSQPANASATVGGTVTFTASASGTAPITYQWTKDGSPINGATSTTLTLNAVTLASAGSYQLTATNAAGSAQSNAATLTVTQPAVAPSFTSQPANASATVGGTASFTASASGTAPITYQWTKDGSPINGATSTTLTLNAVTLASAGLYQLTATNAAGSAQSNAATLTVTQPAVAPSFTSQPANASATVGGTVTFTASASGTAPITYQWTKDGSPINGATSTTLTLNAVTLASAGSYQLTATNAAGSAQSNAASLTVTEATVAPTFSTQPANATATVGGTVTFSASANGTAPITYQWTKDGTPINGATSTTLTLNAVTLASAGSYRLTATNAAGSAQSNAASLTVTEATVAPTFSTQPANATASVGGTVTFSASANGTAPITYQWTKDGTPINGATSTTLTLNAVTLASAGSYRLTATNAVGSAQSNAASLTVTEATVAPTFSTQPANATATVGGTVMFSASANGTAPITYQWTKDGTPINGATSTTLTLNAVTLASAGSYRLTATNAAGSAQSNAASLTVTEATVAPTFSTQPANATATVGGTVMFSASANGTAPITYQWTKDGTPINGATSTTLTLNAVTLASAGSYRLTATNAVGSAQSNAASLTVTEATVAPTFSTQPVNATATVGGTVTFSASANGTAPITYQWTKDGAPINGATSTTLTLNAVTLVSAGSYRLTATNAAGSAQSNTASLTVTEATVAPSFTLHPLGGTVTIGEVVTLSGLATGTAPITYQWTKDGAPIVGAASPTLTLNPVSAMTAGVYRLVATNAAGSALSNPATLTVSEAVAAPQITSQPTGATVVVGGSASFSAVASGSAPLAYQWLKDGAPLAGATASMLSLSAVTAASAGSYRLVVTNPAGSVQSNPVTLTISTTAFAPTVSVLPLSQSVLVNQTVTLTAVATGAGPITYQWTRNGSALVGATSASLVLTGVDETATGTYRVIAHNDVGSTHSNGAQVFVDPAIAPTIVVQPMAQSVVQGASVTLAVEAAGTGPLAYQWFKGGVPVPGAITPQLTLNPVQVSDAGDYSVTVSNPVGSVVSAVAALAVTQGVASAITNVSVVTHLAAEQLLVVGFSVSGGSKSFLLRAVGPGLDVFGVPQTMPDPEIVLYQGGTRLESNDNWGGDSALTELSASVGAFGLAPNSLDAALVSSVGGGRTAQIHGRFGGRVLVEVYDAGRGMSQRLTNISARNRVGTGGDVLIAGFTISGRASKTVLIRAIGPTLGQFGVPGVLDDPKLEVFSGSTKLAENDSWSSSLASVFAKVGAFGLAEGSKDAALVLSLAPGGYTVQVSGVAGSMGEALIEVFEVQP